MFVDFLKPLPQKGGGKMDDLSHLVDSEDDEKSSSEKGKQAMK